MTEDNGTYICYAPRKFSEKRLQLIGRINSLIKEYEPQGLILTVRQIHYLFVTRNWAPNVLGTYNMVQSAINDGRIAGLISWTAIEDRNRMLMGYNTESTPQQALRNLAARYKRDLWEDQPMRVEVWIEKAALVGVIEQICNHLRVDYYAQRGYNSTSEHWRAGQRFANYTRKGQRVIVFHLGDHDPSGINMTESNREMLSMFAGTPIMVQRLALNRNQIEDYNLPPQPAKTTDSRFRSYAEQHGDESWELDALDPGTLANLIEDAVMRVRDEHLWHENVVREEEERRYLLELAGE